MTAAPVPGRPGWFDDVLPSAPADFVPPTPRGQVVRSSVRPGPGVAALVADGVLWVCFMLLAMLAAVDGDRVGAVAGCAAAFVFAGLYVWDSGRCGGGS